MKHFSFVDGLGNIKSSVTVADDIKPEPPPGTTAVETKSHMDPVSNAFSRGAFLAKPPAPEYPATFDASAGRWIPDIGGVWAHVRSRRDQLISASDWVMLPDVSMSSERKQAWLAYRQQLRDITNQPDPTSIAWPKAPS